MEGAADEIVRTVSDVATRLRAIHERAAGFKPSPTTWSIKEIVGHLIDSASNNHQRVVRAQCTTDLTFPGYEQEAWVRIQAYQDRDWRTLIDIWVFSNHQLADVVRRIPASTLDTPCRIGSADPVTLAFLVDDYVRHLHHHIAQIDDRSDWSR